MTDTWTVKANMPIGRYGFSSSATNGKIYAIGGYTWYPTTTSRVDEYDPVTNTWTGKADMPTSRTFFSTSVVNGKVYAVGGSDSPNGAPISVVYEYDPEMDIWTMTDDMLTPRILLSTSVLNGKIYAIGGSTSATMSNASATVEAYDPYPPVVDLNGDAVLDINDLVILIEYWGTDEPLCDIAPPPLGDGIVDVLDLELFMSYWEQKNAAEDSVATTDLGL
jgi:N-acetylneuraminic acid mutarotase